MKFNLIIDPTKEEEITATVHCRSSLTDQLEALILSQTGADRIAAYTEDEMLWLPYSKIECITVLDGKTYAIDPKGKQYRLKQRLYEIEQQLPVSFIRINKSTIANEARLEKFITTYSGGINARFRSGYEDYVSRRCFANIKRRYNAK